MDRPGDVTTSGDGIYPMVWSKAFGGPKADEGYSVQQTQDGGYILVGDTFSYGAGESDIWLIKIGPSGKLQWDRTFGGSKFDHGHSVKQTSDGGYIIAGYTESYAIGQWDVWLIKTDSQGNLDWEKTFGGSSWDAGYSIQQTQDGGYIIAGYTWSYGAGCHDVWLIKTDPSGDKEWDKVFGGPNSEEGNSVQQTQDGGYVITGYKDSYEAGKAQDVWLIKTDSEGNLLWDKTFGSSGWDCGYSGKQTSDGGYIITGYTDSSELGRPLWLIKTDSQGELEWDKTFSSSGLEDVGYSVEQTRDGGYIVAGRTLSKMACDQCWLIKTDSSGNLEWDKVFGGLGFDCGKSVQQTSDGEYIVVGYTDSYGAGSPYQPSVWLIKVGTINPPNQPGCSSPPDEFKNVGLSPTLESWLFSDPDLGDIHIASQWQIREATGDYSNPIFDSGVDTSHLTQIAIPPGILNYSTTYFWRVRHQDNHGVWSNYSSEAKFTTMGGAVPETEWAKTFGGLGWDEGKSIQQTGDGGYIITGHTCPSGAESAAVWLIKTDSEGNLQWDKTFGGSKWDVGRSVRQTEDGGYIVAGEMAGDRDSDVWLIKTDSEGNLEWDKTFGGSGHDYGYSVQQSRDGGYIITGTKGEDLWLIKADSKGNLEWDSTIGGPSWERGESVQQTSDGGYVIAGVTDSYGAGWGDVWLIKTDLRGNIEWDRTFGGSYHDVAHLVQQTRDGGYIIAAGTYSYGVCTTSVDAWLIKTDSAGNLEWEKTFGGSDQDECISVEQTQDGGYIIVGYSYSYGIGGDLWLIKLDSEGNMQWDATFGGPTGTDWGNSVQQTPDGGYIIAGWTTSYGAGSKDVWLLKVGNP
jgi:uncharacterized delta-60 repeat protein